MKSWIIVEVDGADASRQNIDHTNSDNLAVDEVLLVERAEALSGDQRAFAKKPFELAGVALVEWIAMDHLQVRFVSDVIIVDQPVDNSGRFLESLERSP